jgi:hypothetical protein
VSYVVLVRIFCDHDKCYTMFAISERNRGGASKTFALALAARNGWWISSDTKVAYCPKHRAENGKPS